MTALPTAAAPAHAPLWRSPLLPAALLLLLFSGKAVHMDDPLFLWTAQHLLQHPLDFYGFTVNWYGTAMPMHEVNQNPPLAAYYLVPFGAISGWNERMLHLALLPPALAVLWFTRRIAARFTGLPDLAAALVAFSPAFFVSSTTLMCDVLMLALWMAAVHFWLHGLDTDRHGPLLIAAALAACAALTKYFAISLIPLLAVHSVVVQRGRQRLRGLYLLLPCTALAVYELYTRHVYGQGLFFDAIFYAREYHAEQPAPLSLKALTLLSFTGGGFASGVLLLPWAFAKKRYAAALLVAVFASAMWAWGAAEPGAGLDLLIRAQAAFWSAAGAILLAGSAVWCFRTRGPMALLLALWVGGTLVFAAGINHYINARVLLPLLPPIAILMARAVEPHLGARPAPRIPIALAAVLALAVATADWALAGSARVAAETIAAQPRSGRLWFSGHWGFQYYAQRAGGLPHDQAAPDLRPGDVFVTPDNASNPIVPHSRMAERVAHHNFPTAPLLSTMQRYTKAGFYSDVWGPLPFSLHPVTTERYHVYVLGKRRGSP